MEIQFKSKTTGVTGMGFNHVPRKISHSSFAHLHYASSLQRQVRPGDVYHGSRFSKKPRPLGLLPNSHDRCKPGTLKKFILSSWSAGQGQPKLHQEHFKKSATIILPELPKSGTTNHEKNVSANSTPSTQTRLSACQHSKEIQSVLGVSDDLCLPSFHSPQHDEPLGYGDHHKSVEVDYVNNTEVKEAKILACSGGRQAQTDRQSLKLPVTKSENPEENKRALFKRCLHSQALALEYVNFIGQLHPSQRILSDDRRLAAQHEPCERCRLRGSRCPRCLAVRTGGGYIILDQEESGSESMSKDRNRSKTGKQLGQFELHRVEDGSKECWDSGIGDKEGSAEKEWRRDEKGDERAWQRGADEDKERYGGMLQESGSGDRGKVKSTGGRDIRARQQSSIGGGCALSGGDNSGRQSHTSQSSVHSSSRFSAKSRPGSSLGARPGSCTEKHQENVDLKESGGTNQKSAQGSSETERILGEEGHTRPQEKSYDSAEGGGEERNTCPDNIESALHREKKEADKQKYRGKMMKCKSKRDDVKAKHATFRELQGIDPLDYLAKYCIIDKSKLPRYHHVFDNVDRDEDDEINVSELNFALKAVNYDLITDAEMTYVHSVLELGSRYKLNCQLFTVIAALSEKVVALGDMVKRLINKMDFHALEVKMKKCKELFYLLADADAVEAEEGVVTTASLEVELQAGGLTQEHVEFVVDRMKYEGHGFIEFLDYLTYVPLFVDIHDSIYGNPLDFSRTK